MGKLSIHNELSFDKVEKLTFMEKWKKINNWWNGMEWNDRSWKKILNRYKYDGGGCRKSFRVLFSNTTSLKDLLFDSVSYISFSQTMYSALRVNKYNPIN